MRDEEREEPIIGAVLGRTENSAPMTAARSERGKRKVRARNS